MAKKWTTMAALAGALLMGRVCMAADLSGNWIATTGGSQGEPQYTRVSLTTDGNKVGGMWGESKIDGTLADGKLSLTLTDAQGGPAGSLTGTASGDTITGSGTISGGRGGRAGGFGGGMGGGGGMRPAGGGMGGGRGGAGGGTVSFTLTRPVMPPAAPRDMHFTPMNFYATYSAENKPALTIFQGDVVHTWTADAGGVDAKGERHRGGDSNIGPFYVEGALDPATRWWSIC